jgi:two-component system response regulator HydG
MQTANVLIVDDDDEFLGVLQDALQAWGYHVVTARNGAQALELAGTQVFDIVLCDIVMPEMGGIELLRQMKERDGAIDFVMITGYPDVATAVEALKHGAYDYLPKPLLLDDLRHLLSRLAERRFLRREVETMRARLGDHIAAPELIGASPAMRRVKELIARIAPTDSPVIIEGESGTGKELVAVAIHRQSPRHTGPFIPVNCSAIPAELAEEEFFGHVRGAFSGAVAGAIGLFRACDKGTLFLDEITDLPLSMQPKLLRALESGEVRSIGSTSPVVVDVRVIVATNRDIERAVQEGQLRGDLFHRLNVARIQLPPLRDRVDDLNALVAHFIRQLNARFNRSVRGLTPEAMAAFRNYAFPGNVRELLNRLEAAYIVGGDEELALSDFPTLASPQRDRSGATVQRLSEMERSAILEALQAYDGDKAKAAQALGISLATLYRRLKQS